MASQEKWVLRQLSDEDQSLADTLAQTLELSPVLTRVLVGRSMRTAEAIDSYLHPRLSHLHDPYLMYGMERAVERLEQALTEGEPIMLYGDYDVDGVTSVSLVYMVLRDLIETSAPIHYYIPNRGDEGYGISHGALDEAERRGVGLMICLDCGIKAIDEVAEAQRRGIDVIICDHHHTGEVLPDAYAILDPKQPRCSYPCPELSACGVGYKYMQALCRHRGLDDRALYRYLDLVAISIAADIVPMVGENRILLYHGIKQLGSHPTLGVGALMRVSGIEAEPKDVGSIVYHIAPRINASGRLMTGFDVVALLTAEHESVARTESIRLDECNRRRRALDLELTNQAEAQVRQLGDLSAYKALVLYHPDWHIGVLGIVASRLVERYRLPTLILSRSGEHVVGSARSMPSVDLYAALEACSSYLVNFGGHKHAAGITIEEAHIGAFAEALNSYLEQTAPIKVMRPALQVEAQLSIEQITLDLQRQIALMAPFGLGNEAPLFATYRLRDAGGSRVVGKKLQHLCLRMTDRYCKHRPLHGIALGQACHADWVLHQQAFGACYTLEPNTYSGCGGLQLNVKDIHTTED